MSMKALLMVLFIIFAVSLSSDALAAIYKSVDKDGMIYFSDDLQSIPEQYRAAAKIVSGETKEEEEKRPVTQYQEKARMETGMNDDRSSGAQQKPFGSRALTSAIIVVSAMFTFVILGILDIDHKKAVKIVRVIVLWGVSVYLLFAHAGDVVHVFSSMGNHVESVQRESEEKGKKAAKALKALDTLTEQAGKSSLPDRGGTEPEKKE
jgi:hypothetical protein